MLGPKRVKPGLVHPPNIDLRRHVRSRPKPLTLSSTRGGCPASDPTPFPRASSSTPTRHPERSGPPRSRSRRIPRENEALSLEERASEPEETLRLTRRHSLAQGDMEGGMIPRTRRTPLTGAFRDHPRRGQLLALFGACRACYCAFDALPAALHAPHNGMPGNPRGNAIRCTSPRHEGGRRRAIGVVAVLQLSFAQPRRWCDAGTPEATQKAGVPGSEATVNNSRLPARPTASRIRDSYSYETEGRS